MSSELKTSDWMRDLPGSVTGAKTAYDIGKYKVPEGFPVKITAGKTSIEIKDGNIFISGTDEINIDSGTITLDKPSLDLKQPDNSVCDFINMAYEVGGGVATSEEVKRPSVDVNKAHKLYRDKRINEIKEREKNFKPTDYFLKRSSYFDDVKQTRRKLDLDNNKIDNYLKDKWKDDPDIFSMLNDDVKNMQEEKPIKETIIGKNGPCIKKAENNKHLSDLKKDHVLLIKENENKLYAKINKLIDSLDNEKLKKEMRDLLKKDQTIRATISHFNNKKMYPLICNHDNLTEFEVDLRESTWAKQKEAEKKADEKRLASNQKAFENLNKKENKSFRNSLKQKIIGVCNKVIKICSEGK